MDIEAKLILLAQYCNIVAFSFWYLCNMEPVEKILTHYQLKNTKIRHAVLNLFLNSKTGLSHTDVSKLLEIPFDRVTLFRTLSSFEEVGLIHKIIGLNGISLYAFSENQDPEKEESHAHFICLHCGEAFCLDDVFLPQIIDIPKGFKTVQLDVKVKGYCKDCLKKQKKENE